jgi:flagellar biogenesis protein FliO
VDALSVVVTLFKVAAVFVLFWFSLKALGRIYGQGKVRPGAVARPVEVVGRTGVGRKSSVVVIRLGKTYQALGVTEANVTLLGPVEVDQPEAPPAGTQAPVQFPSWKEFVARLQERTVRR